MLGGVESTSTACATGVHCIGKENFFEKDLKNEIQETHFVQCDMVMQDERWPGPQNHASMRFHLPIFIGAFKEFSIKSTLQCFNTNSRTKFAFAHSMTMLSVLDSNLHQFFAECELWPLATVLKSVVLSTTKEAGSFWVKVLGFFWWRDSEMYRNEG